MKNKRPTPIQDQLNKNVIKGVLVTINECMESIRQAEREEIRPENNNYFVYKKNFEYVKKGIQALDRKGIYELLSPEQKQEIKNIVYEVNLLSVFFNANVKHYNDTEKNLSFFDRANLKLFNSIVLKNISKER
ncbi:MAG: hypothetical protein K6F04_03035 [bacterium]|nr:hypothetical protein [bacterium]